MYNNDILIFEISKLSIETIMDKLTLNCTNDQQIKIFKKLNIGRIVSSHIVWSQFPLLMIDIDFYTLGEKAQVNKKK